MVGEAATMGQILLTLTVVMAVAALVPLIAEFVPDRYRLPSVVLFLLGGIVIGPSLLGWADPNALTVLSTVGMGFLFLLAGYELDPKVMVSSTGAVAFRAWLGSVLVALLIMLGLYWAGIVDAPIVLTIALSTTALGTLLPILHDRGLTSTRLGRNVTAAGAVGELGPIVAMALFLGTRGTVLAAVSLGVFLLIVVAAAFIPRRWIPESVSRVLSAKEHSTAQFTLRLVVALLFLLLFVSEEFGFDSVLGAFAAGMLLRRWSGPEATSLDPKLDAVGYGVFIPIFFISSGMNLNVAAILANPLPMLIFFVMLFVVRGLPALFWYRKILPLRERWQMVLFGATALPLLVALAEVGAQRGTLSTAAQASIVGAGALSVLVFPMVASAISRKGTTPGEESEDHHDGDDSILERDSI